MDKRVIFAVAGAGKTTYIVDKLDENKRSLIITYTNANIKNLREKINEKCKWDWQKNVTVMTYFSFLYHFCYKPFFADRMRHEYKKEIKGIEYKTPEEFDESKDKKRVYSKYNHTQIEYYVAPNNKFYSNRFGAFINEFGDIEDVRARIKRYFDEFVIDEIQDFGGRDISFLTEIMKTDINMLFVGDFFQHTYSTSYDGNTKKRVYDQAKNPDAYAEFVNFFKTNGFKPELEVLDKSYRCSKNICDFVSNNLGILIGSKRGEDDNTSIEFVTDPARVREILENTNIVKLHFRQSYDFKIGGPHKNWGDTKGEDCYQDVCVMLNKTTYDLYKKDQNFLALTGLTKNKLYVAITRARGNCYLVEEKPEYKGKQS